MAEGDLVIVHGRFSGFGAPVNWIAADIVRIQNGILVEHWDVIQQRKNSRYASSPCSELHSRPTLEKEQVWTVGSKAARSQFSRCKLKTKAWVPFLRRHPWFSNNLINGPFTQPRPFWALTLFASQPLSPGSSSVGSLLRPRVSRLRSAAHPSPRTSGLP